MYQVVVALVTFAVVVFVPPRLRLPSTLTLLKTSPNKTLLELVRFLITVKELFIEQRQLDCCYVYNVEKWINLFRIRP